MKKIFLLLFCVIHFLAKAQNERILNFHSEIIVDTTTTINVTEKITVFANGNQIKRGIFRTLPAKRNINDKSYNVDYNIVSVKRDGTQEDFHTEKNSSEFKIYIGKKNVTLNAGRHTFEINYAATNQIGFFENYDEIYWNVNGNYWDFPVEKISATIHLPTNANIIQSACYTGVYGQNSGNCTEQKTSENSIEWTAKNLSPQEGLTVAVGFEKGIVKAPPPPPPPSFLEKFGLLIFLPIVFLGLIFYYYFSWKKYGIDPPKPTVYPQFNVPENLSPASLGFIHEEHYHSKLMTAAIINLAVKGFLQIEQCDNKTLGIFKKTSFVLKRTKLADDTLPKEEKIFFENLFGNTDSVSIDGKYNEKIANAVESFKANVTFNNKSLLNKGTNLKYLILPSLVILIVTFITSFFIGFFTKNVATLLLGSLFIALFSLAFFLLISYLTKRYPWTWWLFIIFSCVILIGLVLAFFADSQRNEHLNYFALATFFILSFISLIVYQYLIRRPSEEKLHKQSLIEGFKMYLGTAEEKQLQFLNPPAITPQLFEKLLPYAMVLGVDKIWGQKFQNHLLSMTNAPQSYQSTWYNGAIFSPILFADSFNSSMSQSLMSTATPPSSSGDFGSGSGGGGFSGGGGGGGGGGGW